MDIPTIVITAAHMKDRALGFRKAFIENYLKTNTDYPISAIFQATSLWPSTAGALKLLLQRKSIVIRNGQLTNSVGRSVEATFNPIVNDQQFSIAVLFPSPLSMRATYDESHLAISATTPLPTTFIVKPKVDGAAYLPDKADVLEIAIIDSAITYTFAKSGTLTPAFIVAAQFDGISSDLLASTLEQRLSRSYSAVAASSPQSVRLFSSGMCGGDDSNWYVLCDQHEHITIVHHGTIVEGGQLQYRVLFGPDTQANCDAWDNANGAAACGFPDGVKATRAQRSDRS